MPRDCFYLSTHTRDTNKPTVFLRVDEKLTTREIGLLLEVLKRDYSDHKRLSSRFEAKRESKLPPAERLRIAKELDDVEYWFEMYGSVAGDWSCVESAPNDKGLLDFIVDMYNLRENALRYVELIKGQRQSKPSDERIPAVRRRQSPSPAVARAANEQAPKKSLTKPLREVWDALEGRALSNMQLAHKLGIEPATVRQRVMKLRRGGYNVRNDPNVGGYYRPDAPPPHLKSGDVS